MELIFNHVAASSSQSLHTMALYAEIECCSEKNCKLNSLSGTTMMTSKKNG